LAGHASDDITNAAPGVEPAVQQPQFGLGRADSAAGPSSGEYGAVQLYGGSRRPLFAKPAPRLLDELSRRVKMAGYPVLGAARSGCALRAWLAASRTTAASERLWRLDTGHSAAYFEPGGCLPSSAHVP